MICNWFDFSDRQSWLEARRTLGVGSSEVAALFSDPQNPLRGLSRWESPVSLSYRKRGLTPLEKEDRDADPNLEWGLYVEPAVAKWFADKVLSEIEPFAELHNPGDFAIAVSSTVPMFATVDRLIQLGDPSSRTPGGEVAVLEIKNASAWMDAAWQEEPPLIYQLQVQHQLAVTGLPRGYVCASIGGNAPRWAKIERDEQVIAIIRERCIAFWDSVKRDEDPPMDAHDETARALLQRWPKDDNTRVSLSAENIAAWDERCATHEQIKLLEEVKALRTNELKHAIGEASLGDLPDGRVLALRTDKRGNRLLREVNR